MQPHLMPCYRSCTKNCVSLRDASGSRTRFAHAAAHGTRSRSLPAHRRPDPGRLGESQAVLRHRLTDDETSSRRSRAPPPCGETGGLRATHRSRCCARRGGSDIDSKGDLSSQTSNVRVDFAAIDDALRRLESLDPEQGKLVELRFFGGLSIKDTAEVLGISPATVKREWTIARAWLQRELAEGDGV